MKNLSASAVSAPSTQPTRKDVPESLTWDLSVIYDTDEAWEREFKQVAESIPAIATFAGRFDHEDSKLGSVIAEALQTRDDVLIRLEKLYVFASMRSDEDTTNDKYKAIKDRIRSLWIQFGEAGSYIHPELLELPENVLKNCMERDEKLKVYRRELKELLRNKPHMLSAEQEALLARVADVAGSSGIIYDAITESDLVFPELEDEHGNKIQMTNGNYMDLFLHSKDQKTRERGFKTMMHCYKDRIHSLGATYSGQVKSDMFYSKTRGFDNSLHSAMFSLNLPTTVYSSLISTVHDNLETLQKYLNVRKRILGVKELHLYDLYVPLVDKVEYKVSFEEACKTVLEAVKPLGPDYVQTLKKGFESRWVDVVENKGKATGAYSGGAYTTNPYMLLNWQDSLNWMFTLAHEAGHSMHSFYTRKNQPFQTGDYTIFVAEVASTCNEALLTQHLLNTATNPDVRRYVVNHALEAFRTTLFRQTLFAEFESIAHERAEAGEALTPDTLCAIHKELNEKYYGKGATIDDEVRYEWARIPHFYRSFYVYQYATGISAATALSKQILEEGEPAVKRYLNFLSSGSSKDSIELLAEAGVDLSTSKPIQQALDVFAKYVDEFGAM